MMYNYKGKYCEILKKYHFFLFINPKHLSRFQPTPCLKFLFAFQPEQSGLCELLVGGACYCLGMVFFKSDGIVPFAHAIWHLFVAMGAAIHYYAIWKYLYVQPTNQVQTSR